MKIRDLTYPIIVLSALALLCFTGCTTEREVVDPITGTTTWEHKKFLEKDVPVEVSVSAAGVTRLNLKVSASPYYVFSFDRTAQADGAVKKTWWFLVDTASMVFYRPGAVLGSGVRRVVTGDTRTVDDQGAYEILTGLLVGGATVYALTDYVGEEIDDDSPPKPDPPPTNSDVDFTISELNTIGFSGDEVESLIAYKSQKESGSGNAFLAVNLTAEQLQALAALGFKLD